MALFFGILRHISHITIFRRNLELRILDLPNVAPYLYFYQMLLAVVCLNRYLG